MGLEDVSGICSGPFTTQTFSPFRNGPKIYSRTSVAQTLMAHLPRLFGAYFESLGKNPTASGLG